jgi:hypothetical protein
MPNLRFGFIREPVWAKTPDQLASFNKDGGFDTVEKFEEWLMKPAEGQKPNITSAKQMNIIVTGGSNNNTATLEACHTDRASRSISGVKPQA